MKHDEWTTVWIQTKAWDYGNLCVYLCCYSSALLFCGLVISSFSASCLLSFVASSDEFCAAFSFSAENSISNV